MSRWMLLTETICEFRPQILLCGDSALTVQFGECADIKTNLKVCALDKALKTHRIKGVIETVPTYRSEMVYYDPLVINYDDICKELTALLSMVNYDSIKPNNEEVIVPVYYKAPKSEIQKVAEHEHITLEEAINIHTSRDHYAFMMGVAPGTVYLNCPIGSFTIPRKSVPVPKPYGSSIQIWSTHTTIGAFPTQSGWWVIGQAPIASYDPRRPDDPFLVTPGQWVRFRAIDREEFEFLDRQYKDNQYKREIVIKNIQDLPI